MVKKKKKEDLLYYVMSNEQYLKIAQHMLSRNAQITLRAERNILYASLIE